MPASPEARAHDLAEPRLLGEEWDLLLPWICLPQASLGLLFGHSGARGERTYLSEGSSVWRRLSTTGWGWKPARRRAALKSRSLRVPCCMVYMAFHRMFTTSGTCKARGEMAHLSVSFACAGPQHGHSAPEQRLPPWHADKPSSLSPASRLGARVLSALTHTNVHTRTPRSVAACAWGRRWQQLSDLSTPKAWARFMPNSLDNRRRTAAAMGDRNPAGSDTLQAVGRNGKVGVSQR